MACLAGVLIIVSYNMSEWRTFRSLMKNPKSDVSVLLVTFFLTVIFDLTIAIEVGLLIAMFLFMKRVAETTHVSVVKDEIDLSDDGEIHHDEEVLSLPKGVEVYEIDGPFSSGWQVSSTISCTIWEINRRSVSSACVRFPLWTRQDCIT